MRKHLFAWLSAIGKGWIFMVLGVMSGTLGLLHDLSDSGVLFPFILVDTGVGARWWYLASMAGLVGGSFLGFRKASLERDRLLEEMASLKNAPKVQPERPSSQIFLGRAPSRGRGQETALKVYNGGTTGTFSANLRMLRTGEVYRLLWDRASALEAKITSGGEDFVRLAMHEFSGAHFSYSLFKFDERHKIEGSIFNVGYVPDQSHETVEDFEIVVSSEPESAEGRWSGTFKIDSNGVYLLGATRSEPQT